MSTRATITFRDKYETVHVYKHSDGYPLQPGKGWWGILRMLKFFFIITNKFAPNSTRFTDCTMLAARFAAFIYSLNDYVNDWDSKSKKTAIPKFLSEGVRIVAEPTSDTAYHYIVDCDSVCALGYPTVTVVPKYGDESPYTVDFKSVRLQAKQRADWHNRVLQGSAPSYTVKSKEW